MIRSLRWLLVRFRRRRIRRVVTGHAKIELWHGKEPIVGTVTYTQTEVIPEEDE